MPPLLGHQAGNRPMLGPKRGVLPPTEPPTSCGSAQPRAAEGRPPRYLPPWPCSSQPPAAQPGRVGLVSQVDSQSCQSISQSVSQIDSQSCQSIGQSVSQVDAQTATFQPHHRQAPDAQLGSWFAAGRVFSCPATHARVAARAKLLGAQLPILVS